MVVLHEVGAMQPVSAGAALRVEATSCNMAPTPSPYQCKTLLLPLQPPFSLLSPTAPISRIQISSGTYLHISANVNQPRYSSKQPSPLPLWPRWPRPPAICPKDLMGVCCIQFLDMKSPTISKLLVMLGISAQFLEGKAGVECKSLLAPSALYETVDADECQVPR